MIPIIKKIERGQASVLLALAFIVLLGFTALAIDGGMVYANRRHAQSGSDASSLAGGSAAALYLENHYVYYKDFTCSEPRVINAQNHPISGAKTAAVNSATNNDYTIDKNIDDNNGVTTVCVDNDDNGSWVDKYIDIHTLITADTPTAFAHFVYSGPLRNTVEAITRVWPRTPIAYGNAIVALGLDCDTGGISFDGTNAVHVTGGGIFSNSCITKGGAVSIQVETPFGIGCVLNDCYTDNGTSGSVSPTPEEDTGVPLPPESFKVPIPNSTGIPSHGNYNGDGHLEWGSYTDIRIQNGTHTMDSGLYFVTGAVTINGGTITGSGVTFFLQNGSFTTAGNATTSITAPQSRNCGTICSDRHAIPGVLIYLAPGNTNEVTLLGTEDSEFLGLVFAPDGTIEAGGTSSTLATIHAQLVGKDVFIHGNTEVTINFDDQMNYTLPAKLELNK